MISRFLGPTVLTLFIAACDPGVEFELELDFRPGTLGELGHAKFAHAQGCGYELFTDYLCELDEPVLTGGTTEIAVWGTSSTLHSLTVTSSDDSILRVQELAEPASLADLSYSLTGVAPGTATIELRRGDGTLLDRISVDVADAHELVLEIPSTRQLLLVGSRVSLEVLARDAMGRQLHGRGVIDMETPIGLERTENYPPSVDSGFRGTDHFVFEASELGSIAITATLDGLTASDELEVVDKDAVINVEVSSTEARDGKSIVLVIPTDAEERFVYGGHCAWRLDANLATQLKLPASDELNRRYIDVERAQVVSGDSGTAIITCTIGAASGDTLIEF